MNILCGYIKRIIYFVLIVFAINIMLMPNAEEAYAQTTDGSTSASKPVTAAQYDDLNKKPDGTLEYNAYGKIPKSFSKDEMSLLGETQFRLKDFRTRLTTVFSKSPNLFPSISETLNNKSLKGGGIYFLYVLLFIVGALFIGWLVEMLIAIRIFKPWFVRHLKAEPEGVLDKFPILAYRVLLTIVGITVNCSVALLLALIFYDPDNTHLPTGFTVIILIAAYAMFRLIDVLWRMILSPKLSEYRIPCFSDAESKQIYRWLRGSAIVWIIAWLVPHWLSELGLEKDLDVLCRVVMMFVAVCINLTAIRIIRVPVSQAILGNCTERQPSMIARIASSIWAPVTSIYLIIAWIEMSYRNVMLEPGDAGLIGGSYLVLSVGMVVYGFVAYLIERAFHQQKEIDILNEASREAEQQELAEQEGEEFEPRVSQYRMTSYTDLARRIAGLVALIAGFYTLVKLWSVEDMLISEGFFDGIIDIGFILFLGYAAYHAVRIGIDRRIAEEGGDVVVEPGDEGGHEAASRLATLLPLFRNFLLITIAVTTAFIALLDIGINVAPLFAGAGVIGLAIGFGAQALIKDILSGAFFLIDDAFRKGEYINIGSVKGTVEKISVRSFQLRHHLGYLHTIPFGEIQYLTNFSRDWVMMKLPLRLTYDTDVEKVRKLIKKLGQSLLEDPEIGEDFLVPLKSQGVYKMEDSAMIIRVKFMTRPGDQWVARKKIYASIRELFEKEGIQFAHREVTVRVSDQTSGKTLTEEQKKAVAGSVMPGIIDDELMDLDNDKDDDR